MKFLAEKLIGREYAKSQEAKVPELYYQCDMIEELPDDFVIKPSRGWNAQNVFVFRSGLNLLDKEMWTREKSVEFIMPNLCRWLDIRGTNPSFRGIWSAFWKCQRLVCAA